MTTLLYVEFPYAGPFGDAMTQALRGLAESIALEPGLIRKYWTENAADQVAGGVYMFESREQAEAYLAKHTERLMKMGVPEVRGKFFDVNDELTALSVPPP